MAKFTKNDFPVYLDDEVRRIKIAFSDLLFHELSRTVFGEKAPDVLAAHLGISGDDVRKWLRAEALPCRELLRRTLILIKGTKIISEIGDSFRDVMALIDEIECREVLQKIELTRPRD